MITVFLISIACGSDPYLVQSAFVHTALFMDLKKFGTELQRNETAKRLNDRSCFPSLADGHRLLKHSLSNVVISLAHCYVTQLHDEMFYLCKNTFSRFWQVVL